MDTNTNNITKPPVFVPQETLLSDADKFLSDFREDYRKMAEEKG